MTDFPVEQGWAAETPIDVRALVLRIATENGWGFCRIVGELKKLGIAIGETTVKETLRENGFDPGPKREQTRAEFVERHANTLWACDFFQKKIWTAGGFVDSFVLFFIHVGSRRVIMAGMMPNPTAAWVTQQTRNIAMEFQEEGHQATRLIRDNDSKYHLRQFDRVFEAENVKVVRTCVRAPNMNAFIERWIQSLQVECLDHFVVFGKDHFRHLITSYLDFYKSQRPHQSLDNLPLDGEAHKPPNDWNPEQVVAANPAAAS